MQGFRQSGIFGCQFLNPGGVCAIDGQMFGKRVGVAAAPAMKGKIFP